MTEMPVRKAVVISSHLIRGTGKSIIHQLTTLEENGHRVVISADSASHDNTVTDLERQTGVQFSDMDLIVVHIDPGFIRTVQEFARSGIPGEKLVYGVCKCQIDDAHGYVDEIHPGAFVVEVDCGIGPMLGHVIRRILATGFVTKYNGSVAHSRIFAHA